MLTYPDLEPVAIALGPVKIHWYGLMYLVGFVGGWWLGRVRARRPDSLFTPEQMDDLLFYIALGVVLGGRLGYMLFYGFHDWLENPLRILQVWQGGMSFHGGLLGVMFAMWLFARRLGLGFFQVADFVAPLATIGLFAGRMGNFINAELWGAPTGSPLGMRVPCERAPDLCAQMGRGSDPLYSIPVHATSLYEALLEGVVLLIILWLFSARPRPVMAVSGLFLVCYAVFRMGVEFLRLPDAHIGYLAGGWLTMGHLLSLPMLAGGVLLLT
ncbi:MAG: prolipoprotein diacylglyceryl transferase, partial [Pseudomonadota bacterium]